MIIETTCGEMDSEFDVPIMVRARGGGQGLVQPFLLCRLLGKTKGQVLMVVILHAHYYAVRARMETEFVHGSEQDEVAVRIEVWGCQEAGQPEVLLPLRLAASLTRDRSDGSPGPWQMVGTPPSSNLSDEPM